MDFRNASGQENGSSLFPFTTIQEGIDAASQGDVVWVLSGNYVENVTLKDGVDLLGVQGAEATTIIAASGEVITAVQVEATVQGFTLTSNGQGTAIISNLSNLRIRESVIRDNLRGIYGVIAPSRAVRIENNLILKNLQAGVELFSNEPGDGTFQALVVNNTICGNNVGIEVGNPLETNDLARLTNNILCNNGVGIKTIDGGGATISYNAFWANSSPIDVSGVLGQGNLGGDPRFVDAGNGDYHLLPSSPLIDAGTNGGAPAIDFDGDFRPVDGDGDGITTVDIGADEFIPPTFS